MVCWRWNRWFSAAGIKRVLAVRSKRALITFSAARRTNIGRYAELQKECFPDFQINGILYDVKKSLKSTVRHSIGLGPRYFMWKILSLSGRKSLVLLQLLIPFLTCSFINATADVNDVCVIFLNNNRVSGKEVCLPSLDDVNSQLKKLRFCLREIDFSHPRMAILIIYSVSFLIIYIYSNIPCI